MNERLPPPGGDPGPRFRSAGFIEAFVLAFAQLGDRDFRKPLISGIGLSVAALVIAGVLGVQGLQYLPATDVPALDAGIKILSGLGLVGALILLFPGISLAFVGIFLDDAADAVERRHYPDDLPGESLSFWRGIACSMRFAGITIGLNLLALPVYLLLIFAFPLNLALYYALNGYLFGREYHELVALRHLPEDQARALRHQHRRKLWLFGSVVAFMFTIPVLNLLAPLVATAAAVHIFKGMTANS